MFAKSSSSAGASNTGRKAGELRGGREETPASEGLFGLGLSSMILGLRWAAEAVKVKDVDSGASEALEIVLPVNLYLGAGAIIERPAASRAAKSCTKFDLSGSWGGVDVGMSGNDAGDPELVCFEPGRYLPVNASLAGFKCLGSAFLTSK